MEIELLANLELPEEVDDALRFGCAGVGLYRSEFFYIEKSPELPTEEEHYELLSGLSGVELRVLYLASHSTLLRI